MTTVKAINVDTMNRKELEDLRKQIDQAMTDYDKKQRQKALEEAEKAAKAHGYSLPDLTGGKKGTRKKGSASPARYQHPENPGVTWSGKGRQPAWVKEHVETGGSKEDLAIK